MDEHLIAYDYGTGGLWAVVIAPSALAIRDKYPEVAIATERPNWMTDEEFERLRQEPLWLDEEVPSGLFGVVIADRSRK
jgi:hypothetical protein